MNALVFWVVGIVGILIVLVTVARVQLKTPNTLPRICIGCKYLQRGTEFGQHVLACHKRFSFPGMYKGCKHKLAAE